AGTSARALREAREDRASQEENRLTVTGSPSHDEPAIVRTAHRAGGYTSSEDELGREARMRALSSTLGILAAMATQPYEGYEPQRAPSQVILDDSQSARTIIVGRVV